MATLHFLGTGAALSDPHRTTTMLALENDHSAIVIDCGGDVLQRLAAADVSTKKIRGLIITHEHADHVAGFPLFMERIWLAGRREPLPVYGIAPALAQARRTHESFDLSGYEGMPEILWQEVAYEEGALLLDNDDWHIYVTPGRHFVPVVGLRIRDKRGGGTLCYSCDTAFHEPIIRLAEGAQVLVHEATMSSEGHASAEEAAEVAKRAGVQRLWLVHLPPEAELDDARMGRARAIFAHCDKALEGGSIEF